jgi:hypothetical protein
MTSHSSGRGERANQKDRTGAHEAPVSRSIEAVWLRLLRRDHPGVDWTIRRREDKPAHRN